ncbi:hypothetical protein Ae406Ps2_5802c [Pseudonocardia sp. Ae406_Ps2]|nr:hypothetical protein Ae331Ps2_0157 [Pseudonocardia sp. Ae331_Ps2]OLM05802.1 hypothetical protein Ae406Ps2_5802c [Pseudonocardia sp. Ae406_Ps2]OLM15039.1 hypothetical protein Ae505Ps2_5171 [Pseudonocardia sp. Ae505_Ps2]OLM27377.1 hypothetical protein Ae706Ps2_5811c [Pseudonocardia sp. Ae706_Ps2]
MRSTGHGGAPGSAGGGGRPLTAPTAGGTGRRACASPAGDPWRPR